MMNSISTLIKPSSRWKLFSSLTRSSPNPHHKTYSKKEQSLLSAFKKSRTKLDIQQLHAHVLQTGFIQNLFVVGKIVVFCAVSDECSMNYAVSVFEKIENPDGFLWNTMIRGFATMNQVDKVFCYYKMMLEDGQNVDNFTLSFLLKASGQFGSVLLGKQLHCSVVKHGLECHLFVRNTLIHMYGMMEEVIVARQLFDEMPEPDLVGWNTIIDCYVCCGKHKEALDLFARMQDACVKPDDATLVVILSACAGLGALEVGRTLLAGCHMHGNIKLAENVRRDLLEVDPDHSSDYVLLANTYASLEDWNQVSRIRRSMAANRIQKPSPGNSFIPERA
ncbi:hypothetical protein L1987_08396 [Smallanthus sonchifolius]|uniref:Uncharacterized protein n=1 Tax=Smallanthus sonchifolius TaxID=185202 RepID=A0ACB9JL30_9ASTR|nr:hypothetical protein L1987_08396 [Smallanthus sonchifolius]